MTGTALRALALRVYEAINAQDIKALEELFDPQIIRHATGEMGIEHAKASLITTFTLFPNIHFTVDDLIAEGDRVALRVTIHGIATHPGKPLPLILEIFRVEQGRVVEIWGAGTLDPSQLETTSIAHEILLPE